MCEVEASHRAPMGIFSAYEIVEAAAAGKSVCHLELNDHHMNTGRSGCTAVC